MVSGEGKKKPQNVNENRNKSLETIFLVENLMMDILEIKLKIKNPLNTIKKTVDDTAKSAGSKGWC